MSVAIDVARQRAPVQDESFRTEYLQALSLIHISEPTRPY